ncbi:MAG: Fur family transcriptional regulator [Verrucomicrobiota bacterium]
MGHIHTTPDLDTLLEQCSREGLRKTSALKACLEVLLKASQPLTLQEIGSSPDLGISCDPATIYRLITRLEEKRIVRRVGFHSRAAHFCLRESDHQDYLVCRDCGSVEVLNISCPVEDLESEIAKKSGYSDLDHELEFFGRCGTCQD